MPDLSASTVAIIVLAFVLAGLVKGVTGMGLPPVALAVLGGVMAPVAAVGLLVVPAFVTNLWQYVAGPSLSALTRRFWILTIGVFAGTIVGIWFLTSDESGWTTAALGLALAAYALVSLLEWRPTVSSRAERLLSPVVGAATGLVTGATGVSSFPSAPYLQSLGLDKDELVQSLGLVFTVGAAALALGLAGAGAYPAKMVAASSLAVAPALLGMWLGAKLRSLISPESFRRWFLIALLLIGLQLAVRPLL